MRVVGLNEEQIGNVLQVLSSILQLGNLEFITTGGAQIQDKAGKTIIYLKHLLIAGFRIREMAIS